MVDNIQNLLDPQDLAEAKQEGLRKKIEDQRIDINELPALPEGAIAVSYTHLTLPTTPYV